MKKIHDSAFQSIEYDASKGVLYETWKPETSKMNDKDFKKEMLAQLNAVKFIKPKGVITNTFNLNYAIHPDIQDWMNEEIFPHFITAGVKKVAFLLSEVLITQLAVQQTMNETTGKKFILNYFSNIDEAEKWLLLEAKSD